LGTKKIFKKIKPGTKHLNLISNFPLHSCDTRRIHGSRYHRKNRASNIQELVFIELLKLAAWAFIVKLKRGGPGQKW
jgi:hypothetical protein